MTPSEPLVSICIPTYRGAAYLAATVESALSQSYRQLEIWIVDDASPDDTERVARSFTDPRVRFVRNERNLGPMGNWNRCLELAGGKYYKLLPQDDLLAPDSLAEQVEVLERDADEQIALVFGSRIVIDHLGRRRFERGFRAPAATRVPGRELIRRCVKAGTNLIGEPGNGLIRRALTERVGQYDTEHPYMVDLDYWFRVLAFGDAWYTGRRSSCFRISPSQWSVALGNKQLADFNGFVDKYARDASLGIDRRMKAISALRARINTVGRALIYKSLFAGSS